MPEATARSIRSTGRTPDSFSSLVVGNGRHWIGGGSWSTLLVPELAPEIRRPNGGNVLLVFALPAGAESRRTEVER
jgi:hypothetical protein